MQIILILKKLLLHQAATVRKFQNQAYSFRHDHIIYIPRLHYLKTIATVPIIDEMNA